MRGECGIIVCMDSFMAVIYFLFLILIALTIFRLWFNSAKQKGLRGERIVANRLRRGLPGEYLIFNDLYLPLDDGTTTQLDHVIVSRYGVFIVETKNYDGWIFANERSAKWTQSIYRKKSQFQNPIRQNYHHRCALANVLGLPKEYIIGVVAFTGNCDFKTDMPEGVVYSRRAADYIKSFSVEVFKSKEVDMIAEAIKKWDASISGAQRTAHVANLKKRKKREADSKRENHSNGTHFLKWDSQPMESSGFIYAAPVCPLCGGEMVKRMRKSDGKAFYGCKAFPKCRGVVDIG